jgi:hypothetical protein
MGLHAAKIMLTKEIQDVSFLGSGAALSLLDKISHLSAIWLIGRCPAT